MRLTSRQLPSTRAKLEHAVLTAYAIVAIWGACALVLTGLAAQRIRRAQAVLDTARSMHDLSERSPARPLVIGPDNRIELDSQLRDLFHLDADPASFAGLAEGGVLPPEEVGALEASVEATRRSGDRLDTTLETSEGRIFAVRGELTGAGGTPGAILGWVIDISEAEEAKRRLARRLEQTENALDSLTHLIESAPFPMWYRGPDMSLGLVNSAFVAAVEGEDAADVIARGAELIDGSGDQSARAGAQKALDLGAPYQRHQPATIGGERRMLRIVDVPLPTGAVAGFALDIQDLEDVRYQLAQNIQSQRELADRMAAGAAQFDADGRLSFYNQPFHLMSQLDTEDLDEGIPFDRLLDAMREKGRVPEVRDYPSWKAERREWFTATEELIEEDWILANGDHLRVVGQPLPDGGLRLILEDRTEQVRLASARDTLLRVRAATFDNLFEVISVFASDGRLYLWNRRFSRLWGLEEGWLSEHPRVDELVPAMAQKLVNPTEAAQIRELVRATTAGRQSGSGRLTMTDGRGFEYAAVPLPDGNVLVTMVDITDSLRIESALRERARALEEADSVKTDFVANMSYELRTPLTSIGGFAQMLAAGYAGELSANAKEYLDAILQSVERLSRMVDRVLDLTRTEGGALQIERERVDLEGLVTTVGEGFLPRAREQGQQLRFAIDAETGIVEGDARRLREAIENILQNAVNYAGHGAEITLETVAEEEAVRITVTDNGEGIDPDEQPRVFDRFHRSEPGERGEAALGLGLPLTRQFIEAHGGRVELLSKRGEGTAVTLVIPRGESR
ncbi:sensor histidine kinase [Sphingomicrobium astaxanthinifaciens]|uniref:sensor histidine kinase n=1 Tax=Sphingomicrobium astaxanthinifaciens TaxID=1227949 RepID=UPI001FCCA578|nr:PAS domain-containing sensor histidine kinase [Sphingomicrobium astaxanthinifaciens]MCJ7422294.1 PAS-domain containing protein [Sphingomicrobium astaxanthinifaciens]